MTTQTVTDNGEVQIDEYGRSHHRRPSQIDPWSRTFAGQGLGGETGRAGCDPTSPACDATNAGFDAIICGQLRPDFRGTAWSTTLTEAGVRISMDGRGRCMDNIFIEPLWRSLKHEAIYNEEPTDGFRASCVIRDWMGFNNTERPHSAPSRQHRVAMRLPGSA